MAPPGRNHGRRSVVGGAVIAAAVLLGLILIIAGVGKIPGQTEFSDAVLGSFWTPTLAKLIVHVLPWFEVALGVLLVLGVFPRIVAAVTIPITLGFMANNGYALVQGVEEFPECASCFGFFEQYFGSLSPRGALIFDVILLGLAVFILVRHRDGFFTFRFWFYSWRKEGTA